MSGRPPSTRATRPRWLPASKAWHSSLDSSCQRSCGIRVHPPSSRHHVILRSGGRNRLGSSTLTARGSLPVPAIGAWPGLGQQQHERVHRLTDSWRVALTDLLLEDSGQVLLVAPTLGAGPLGQCAGGLADPRRLIARARWAISLLRVDADAEDIVVSPSRDTMQDSHLPDALSADMESFPRQDRFSCSRRASRLSDSRPTLRSSVDPGL